MSEIKQHIVARHLRAEPTSHVLRYRKGRLVSSGQGGAFWFRPLNAAIAKVTPTWHGVELARHLSSGNLGTSDLVHLGYLLVLSAIGLYFVQREFRKHMTQ